ncbi:hypothetical protein AYO41_03765 [Verrucomicrobia bacterium SCGC AG-212-E04]|nr:hypothetical protein AYO41_03685 [Verrucomicrobia bacterium SCGC AG-212-E04]OAI42751.1 hypothetical protein AYO41_03765 [Verrucomicrobia bacterium SCGC AG-212-E04]
MSALRQPPIASIRLVPLMMIAFVTIAISGLVIVYLKNHLHSLGAQRVMLEREMKDLAAKAAVNDAQIVNLTSRAALQRRLEEGFLKLVPIRADRLVRVRPSSETRESVAMGGPAAPYQPVSHTPLR